MGGEGAARGRLPGRSHLLMSQCVPSCPRGGSLAPQHGSPHSALLWEGPPQGLARGSAVSRSSPGVPRGGAAHLANSGGNPPAPGQSQGVVHAHLDGAGKVPMPSCLGQDPKCSLLCSKAVSLGAGAPNSNHLPTPPQSRAWRTAPRVACLLREGGSSVSAQGGPTGSIMAPKDITS